MRSIGRAAPLAAMVLVPLCVLVTLRTRRDLDVRWFSPYSHLVVVTAIAACALLVAVAAAVTAVRSQRSSTVWLGIGCMVVGLAMVGHGLTTPRVLGQPDNRWVGRLPYLAMLGLTVGLAAAGSPRLQRANDRIVRRCVTVLLAPTVVVAAFVGLVVLDPHALHGARPFAHEESVFDVVSVACVLTLAVVVARHWPRWRLGRDLMQLAIVLSATMSIAALMAFEHGVFGRLSWWDYHAYLLAGFGGTVVAIAVRARQERTIGRVLGTAFDDDPFDLIVAGYPEALRSMVRAVEVKDAYTHGHSERTARLAVRLGVRLRLDPDRLRVVACGAYLHDLGKIGIPDHILNKPGRLSEDERAVIETHPQLGYEIAAPARSLRDSLPIILHHHERVDGCGYPHRLAGDAVPFTARIVAVADVWDALTSRRSYRAAMAPEDALAHIRAGAGSHFDPQVVKALEDVLRDDGITTDRHGEAETAWEAAQRCHEIDEEEAVLAGV